MKSRPKILVLGWEFPPLLTGGLGIACYGLSKALAEYADLTVIVPRSDPSFRISQFKLIGLNHIRLEDVNEQRKTNDFHKFAAVHEIELDLDPYPATEYTGLYPGMQPSGYSVTGYETIKHPAVIRAAEAEALFSDMDVYGPNIMRKVAAYTEVVCKLARTLEYDLIHAHDWITYAAAGRLKQETGKPMVVHVHSLETDRVDRNARNTVYDIERRGMQLADRVLPVSNFTRNNIIENYGIDGSKISTVYNGIAPVHKFKTAKPVRKAVPVPTTDNEANWPVRIPLVLKTRYSAEPDYVYRTKTEIYDAPAEEEALKSAVLNSGSLSAPVPQAAGSSAGSILPGEGKAVSTNAAEAVLEKETEHTEETLKNDAALSGLKTGQIAKPVVISSSPLIATSPEEKWVVFLGRVTRQKSPFMMLETARKLVKKMPNVKFYVAGTGDQLGILQAAVAEAGLNDSFVFTGFISKAEVGLLLSMADVYFMPSISEPFGLSAVEAAQFDVPCVISKQSGVSELLTNALQANFWDTDKFSDLLYAVLNFDGIRETIVGHTRNDLDQITWQHAARTVSGIYTELIH